MLEVNNYTINTHLPLDMINEISANKGADIIEDYVRKNAFWKEIYFNYFTTKQKVLFFLPVLFFVLPIYGTYSLFYNNSWTLFITFGIAMMASIYWFFKQKTHLEQIVFKRLYLTDDCKTVSELHLQRLSALLGKQNTPENREAWKVHFKQKNGGFLLILTTIILFGSALHFMKGEYLSLYYVVMISLVMLLMTFAFIGQAFAGFKSKRATYNEAYILVVELDKIEKHE